MNDDNYLLDAVDALTKPVVSKVIQDGPIGSGLAGSHTVIIELPPLLTQLDDAIRGTIGIGGSSSTKHERNVLDADALFRFVTISALIKDWCRMVDVSPSKDALDNLRKWYVARLAKQQTPESDRFYEKKMRAWAGQISTKLNPANIRELPDRCPVCDADLWYNPDDKLPYLHPLIVKYRPDGADMIQQAEAMCRACAQTWGIRELAYLLETKGDAA